MPVGDNMKEFIKKYESKEGTKYVIHFTHCEFELRMSFEVYECCSVSDEDVYYLDRDDFSPTKDIRDAEMFLEGLVMWRGDWECICHFPDDAEYEEYELPNIVEVYDYAKNVCIQYEPLLKEISL